MVAKAAKAVAKKAEAPDPGPKPFVFTPKGGDPIELPNYSLVRPKDKTMWFEYQLYKRNHSLVAQIQFAMESANIPEATQDRVFELPDEDLLDLVNGWSSSATGASMGES